MPVAAAVAIVIGVLTYRPVRPMPWLMLALGMLGLAAASVAWSDAFFGGDLAYPGIGEAVGVLAYPAIFVGVVGITSRQRGARDLLAGAEPVIYTIALSALVWLAVMEPWFDRRQLPVDGAQWIWLFVGLDVLLALLAYRRADRLAGRPAGAAARSPVRSSRWPAPTRSSGGSVTRAASSPGAWRRAR